MIYIGEEIHKELNAQRRSAAWLAEQLYCDRTNVYRIFKMHNLNCELLMRISKVLDRDFFKLYSDVFENDASDSSDYSH